MKMLTLISMVFLAAGNQLAAQTLHMSDGDVFTYEFNTLALRYAHLSGVGNSGQALVGLSAGDSLSAVDAMRLELFENSLTETPFRIVTMYGTNSSSALSGFGVSQAGVWQDLQGVVRITMIHGSADVSALHITAIRETAQYGIDPSLPLTVSASVPEPSSLGLLLLGGILLGGYSIRLSSLSCRPKKQICS